jgi:hypothetical protein
LGEDAMTWERGRSNSKNKRAKNDNSSQLGFEAKLWAAADGG